MLCISDVQDDIAAFIKDRVPKAQIRTVFDVGSNVGWFTHEFGKVFREASFYLFEPSPPLFALIDECMTRFPYLEFARRARAFPVALGHSRGVARVTAVPDVTVNHILEEGEASFMGPVACADVEVITGDQFCEEHAIRHIDYLKVDTEGYDMNVLIGFTKMLSSAAIDFVQVEAGMEVDNRSHTHLSVFSGFLSLFGFRFFRFINQASSHNVPYMTRADVVFIRENAARRYGNI